MTRPTNNPPAPHHATEPRGQTAILQPAAQITRVAPFFATTIDPAIARHGAALLSADSSHYAAAAIQVTVLEAASVLGHAGTVWHAGHMLDGSVTPGTLTPPAPVQTLQVDAPAFLGFGPDWADDPHGMTGILARLVTFAQLRRGDTAMRLLLPDALAPAGWLRDMLALLGIEAAVHWLPDQTANCHRLIVTRGIDPAAISPLSHVAARALSSLVPLTPAGPRWLYLYSNTMAGRIVNEAEVAATLAAQGFTLLDTSQSSLADRIALLRQASGIVAAQGPVLAELAFCPPGAAVLELVGPANPSMVFWSLASCAGLRYGYVVGDAVGLPDWNGAYAVPLPMLAHAAALMTAA